MFKIKTTSMIKSKMDTVRFEILFSSVKDSNEESFSDVTSYSENYKNKLLLKGFKDITIYACKVNKNYITKTIKYKDGNIERTKRESEEKGYKATQLFVLDVNINEKHKSFKYIYESLKGLEFSDFRYYWICSKSLRDSMNEKLKTILISDNRVQAAKILNKKPEELDVINVYYGIREFSDNTTYEFIQKECSSASTNNNEDCSFNFNLLDELFKSEYSPEIDFKDSITVEWCI